ncbi:cytochrome P450 [Candidatus Poriferisodalis sp.]|uniref:cytochrome P450 n=1 Tax=Candidatus Poriferisodalis sp. TaxID=3101277 RepID=UPI003B01A83B
MATQVTATETDQVLTLCDELMLLMLNEETGYFHQVPGWHLSCAMAGAALAGLSLRARIDTDMESLILLDETPTGNPVLDLALSQIANESKQRSAQYWVEQLAPRAEMMIDLTLDRLVQVQILEHHEGDFWTLAPAGRHSEYLSDEDAQTTVEHVKARVDKSIFGTDIPDSRDIIIIALANVCDVLRFIFDFDEAAEQRVQLICQMDLIGRAIADAVTQNLAGTVQSAALTKTIPKLPIRRLATNKHLREGNVPAGFAQLTEEFGPVFKLKSPLEKQPMICVAGPRVNRWVHRYGRMYLRSSDYLRGLEEAYFAAGLLPAIDGADHFRLRKSLRASYGRERLEHQIDETYGNVRKFMATWTVGDTYGGVSLCRQLTNACITPTLISVEADDVMDDIISFKSRALKTQVIKVMPPFMLRTPGMKRKAKAVEVLFDRVVRSHTATQRMGCPRDQADDILSLHKSDPTFVPESNLRFMFSAAVLASMYAGDELSFLMYAMLSQPDLHEQIRAEADALFEDGNPTPEDFKSPAIDVTRRFIMEAMRLYPTIPMSMRTVMNSCVVEDFELPVGSKLLIATTACHYMEELFPDPYTFDIDRYLPSRAEHRTPGYAPFGLGTHGCLGSHMVDLQLTLNLLMVAHYFELQMKPTNYRLKIDAFPSLSPNGKLKFTIAKQRHPLPV